MIGIIFIGMPCSGKSTLAKQICTTYGLTYISSGDIARRMAEENDDIRQHLNNGGMAPEYKMRHMIYNDVRGCIDTNRSFVLDGFPRFREQYEWFINTFKDIKLVCIHVMASVPTVYARYNKRKRSDDNVKSFTQRVRYYNNNTLPLIIMMDNVHHVRNDSDCNNRDVINHVCNIVEGELDADYS